MLEKGLINFAPFISADSLLVYLCTLRIVDGNCFRIRATKILKIFNAFVPYFVNGRYWCSCCCVTGRLFVTLGLALAVRPQPLCFAVQRIKFFAELTFL